jgi:hypothetical protein
MLLKENTERVTIFSTKCIFYQDQGITHTENFIDYLKYICRIYEIVGIMIESIPCLFLS